jgi:hypothetical protein
VGDFPELVLDVPPSLREVSLLSQHEGVGRRGEEQLGVCRGTPERVREEHGRRVVILETLTTNCAEKRHLPLRQYVRVLPEEFEDALIFLLEPVAQPGVSNPCGIVRGGAVCDVAQKPRVQLAHLSKEQARLDSAAERSSLPVVPALVILRRREEADQVFLGRLARVADGRLEDASCLLEPGACTLGVPGVEGGLSLRGRPRRRAIRVNARKHYFRPFFFFAPRPPPLRALAFST